MLLLLPRYTLTCTKSKWKCDYFEPKKKKCHSQKNQLSVNDQPVDKGFLVMCNLFVMVC